MASPRLYTIRYTSVLNFHELEADGFFETVHGRIYGELMLRGPKTSNELCEEAFKGETMKSLSHSSQIGTALSAMKYDGMVRELPDERPDNYTGTLSIVHEAIPRPVGGFIQIPKPPSATEIIFSLNQEIKVLKESNAALTAKVVSLETENKSLRTTPELFPVESVVSGPPRMLGGERP